MKPHHRRAVEALTQRYQADPTCRALVLVGSIAAGNASDASDIDYIAVVTDEEFARRRATCSVHNILRDICEYPGGYAEGKHVPLAS